ncbi:MAG TPA: vWA domain-containing protein [Fimbriimonas sp.]|nr:vWA domain-containing protein [Fimbriimonas sp.]
MRRGFEDPVMSCFLIDASPSMEPYTDAVIAGQRLAIDTLRGSAKCRKGALYVGQWLFSGEITLLNKFLLLEKSGSDAVPVLDPSSYRPQDGNGTALYATVLHVLQDMAANMAYALGQNIRTTFTIGLITDGEDNCGGASPDDIKKVVNELRSNGHLAKAAVIGIENSSLPRQKIEQIRSELGFDEAIFVGQSASEIRRAFALASQSAVRAQS